MRVKTEEEKGASPRGEELRWDKGGWTDGPGGGGGGEHQVYGGAGGIRMEV